MEQISPSNLRKLSALELHEWLQSTLTQPVLLDVREDDELAIAPFPKSVIHLPLSKITDFAKDLRIKLSSEEPIVVICHSGIRSRNFGQWLIEQNWNLEVWNLEGGIDSWSVEVDPTVTRY